MKKLNWLIVSSDVKLVKLLKELNFEFTFKKNGYVDKAEKILLLKEISNKNLVSCKSIAKDIRSKEQE